MITYILDKLRIAIGDSQCPLYYKCSGADENSDVCVSYRGRKELGEGRTECYEFFKPKIRAQNQGLLAKLAEKVMKKIMEIEESTAGRSLEE